MRTEIVEVPVRVFAPIPEELTERCNIPSLPEGKPLTYGDVIGHLMEVYGTVEQCNAKLQTIRELSEKEVAAYYPKGCRLEEVYAKR